MEITPAQLKSLLFTDLTCDLDESNKIKVRFIHDWTECKAIPQWLAAAILEDESARTIMHVQILESHTFLWPREAWLASRDRKLSVIAAARAGIAADIAAARAQSAQTKYQQQIYEFVTKLAERIVDNYFPHMKKGYLKSTFQGIITRCNFDPVKFRARIAESFDDVVLDTCWVNEPEKQNETTTSETASQEGPEQLPQVQEAEGEGDSASTQEVGEDPERDPEVELTDGEAVEVGEQFGEHAHAHRTEDPIREDFDPDEAEPSRDDGA